jgi:tetratricopeptide (TPR) repeat protein
MVGRVVGGKALPSEVLEQILARTDGVPLFVEELTKAVLESGLLRDEGDRYELVGPLPPLAIPATLQDSLMARLDRLAPIKEVAQVAAVIGREFPHDLLAAAVSLSDNELRDALGQLVVAELVFPRGEPPVTSYVFKHALVRDAAYQSLLKSKRQQLHARIAAVLEERSAGAAAEPELLARHCAGAGLAEWAARYWQRAAELAIGRSANLEAIAHSGEVELQLRALPPSAERTRAELEVQLTKSIAIRAGRGYAVPEAERVFLRASELCEELGDQVRLAHALRGLFGFYYVAGRWPDATRVAERLGTVAERLDDRTVLCLRWYVEGATRMFCGEPAEAVRRLRQALHYYDESDRDTHIRLTGHEMASLIRFHLSIAQWLAGMPEQALHTSVEALGIARRAARPVPLAQTLANIALLRVLARDWDAAEALAAETREVSARYGIPDYISFGDLLAGTAIAAQGDVTRGAALARNGLAGLRQGGWQSFVPMLLACLALTFCTSGDKDEAIEAAAEALRMARANGELIWEAEALRVVGEVKRATGAAEVEADMRTAIDIACRQGGEVFRAARHHLPSPALGEPGQAAQGPCPSGPCLRLVHRGLRHAGLAGREGTASGAGLSTL